MRSIDADALMDAMREEEFQIYPPLDEIDGVIERAPTIDAVPVVRCKDCANTDLAVCLPDGIFYCNEWDSTTRGHWHCCRGEQKEEKEND